MGMVMLASPAALLGAEGEAQGDRAVVLRAAGAVGSIDLGDAERCFLQWSP